MRQIFIFCMLFVSISGSFAQKKALDTQAYKRWNILNSKSISPSGKWVMCWMDNFMKEQRDSSYVRIYNTVDDTYFDLRNVSSACITKDEKWLSYKNYVAPGEFGRVKDTITIINLKTGKKYDWKGDSPCYMTDITDYVFYEKILSRTNYMTRRVYVNLETRDSLVLDSISSFENIKGSKSFFYLKWEKDTSRSIWIGDIHGKRKRLDDKIKGRYMQHFFTSDKKDVFLFMASDEKYDKETDLLYTMNLQTGKHQLILDWKQVNFPEGYKRNPSSYSVGKDLNYIYIDLIPRNTPTKEEQQASQQLNFELWSWDDEVIPTMQRPSGTNGELKYVYNIKEKKWIFLNDSPKKVITKSIDKSDYVLKSDFTPYEKDANWTERVCFDLYMIDLQTGEERLLATKLWNMPTISPNGKHAIAYDETGRKWYAVTFNTGIWQPISDNIPYPVYQEDYDYPQDPPAYGFAAWDETGDHVVIRDRYDLWDIDLNGKQKTRCLTGEYGRKNQQQIQIELLGENKVFHEFKVNQENLKKNILVKAIDEQTCKETYYTLKPDGKLVKLMEGDYYYIFGAFSANGKKCIWQRMNYQEFPDLWCSNADFSNPKRIVEVNSHQKEYTWGSVKIVEWNTLKGKRNRGLLYLPENYDSSKTYPVIVSFYERHIPTMHEYSIPLYSHSVINVPTYVSQGYVVFRPDIHYSVGYPGEDCLDAVISGVNMLLEKGIADKERIGIQGHSWSGFQTAYLLTRTDIFRCAQIGAGVVNAVSAYTGLRGNGSPRMFMYELTQSRLGKTLWEGIDLYLESSPILRADRITAPILILHNDRDDAVPFTQGLDLFFAMRRLHKSAWLINYKGERHVLREEAAKEDWTIRMQQFFDHYLKGFPQPRWMKEGISVEESKTDLKYELTK